MGKTGPKGIGPALLLVCLALALPPRTESRPAAGSAAVELPDGSIPLAALTFDDGPHPRWTAPLLDGLALREVSATFFVVGECIPGNEELLRRMEREGHQIGVHTYDHVRITGLSRADYDLQVGKTRAMLTDLLGAGDYWLRPPYGIVDDSVVKREDGPIILWSVDPEDWKDGDVHRIAGRVLEHVKGGDIILMHDIYSTSVEGALQIVDGLLDEGFCFVTVEQLFALRGIKPEGGVLYRAVPPA